MVGAPERPQYWYSNEPRQILAVRRTVRRRACSIANLSAVRRSTAWPSRSATAWLVVAAKMPAPPTWAVEATADRAVPKTDEPRPPTKKIEFAPAFAADRFDALQAERDAGAVNCVCDVACAVSKSGTGCVSTCANIDSDCDRPTKRAPTNPMNVLWQQQNSRVASRSIV